MFIILVPFPNDLIGKYPTQQMAVIIYAIILFSTGISMCLLWLHASIKYRLIDETLNSKFIRILTLRLLFSPSIFLLSIPISFINPLYAVTLWIFGLPIGLYVERRYIKR
jgi:uncharacterized membrane protein